MSKCRRYHGESRKVCRWSGHGGSYRKASAENSGCTARNVQGL